MTSSTMTSVVTVVVTAAIFTAPGCRGGRPFGSFVNVTQQPDAGMPHVDPPPQRLATAGMPNASAARSGATPPPPSETISQRSPGRGTSAASRVSSPQENRSAQIVRQAAASDDETDLSSRRIASQTPGQSGYQTRMVSHQSEVAARQFDENPAKPMPTGQESTRQPIDPEHQELMKAFADYPPEVQREALRRLVAATSKTARRTNQPIGFTRQLERQTNDLPELPDLIGGVAPVPAQRLGLGQSTGGNQPSGSPHRGTLADQIKQSVGNDQNEFARLSEVHTQPSATQVKPVSAIQPSGSSEQGIARAAAPTDVTGSDNPSGQTIKADDMRREGPMHVRRKESSVDVASLTDRQLYGALLKQLSTEREDESEAERFSRLVKLRHLMVLSGDVDSAVEQIEGMAGPEQELLRHQLLGLWTMVDPAGHPVASRRITTALPQLRQATQFAAAAADSLEVRRLTFCTDVRGYGQVQPFPSNRFKSRQEVLIYIETENLVPKETDGQFTTEVRGSLDIFDQNDRKIVSQLLPADRQVWSSSPQDYYNAYRLFLPAKMAPGKYRFRITVEDVLAKKYGQSEAAFEIVE